MIYNELMSDFEMDEKDFAADSWSLAVDSSFLQQHKKEVMKQQDVIYGEPGDLLPQTCPLLCWPPPLMPLRLGLLVSRTLPGTQHVASGPPPWGPLVSQPLSPSHPSRPSLASALCPFRTQHRARGCGGPRHGEGGRETTPRSEHGLRLWSCRRLPRKGA